MQSAQPKIRAIRADTGRRLVVTWKGGAESVVDLAPHLARYAIFAPLRADTRGQGQGDNPVPHSRRRRAGAGARTGPDDMEIAADTLWRLALEQGAAWLRAWRTCARHDAAGGGTRARGQSAHVALLRGRHASVAEDRPARRDRPRCPGSCGIGPANSRRRASERPSRTPSPGDRRPPAHPIGGLRLCHCVARSYAAATRNTVASSKYRPTNCTDSGSPLLDRPDIIASAGCPVTLNGVRACRG